LDIVISPGFLTVDIYPKNMAKHNKGSGRRNYLARRRKNNERQEDEVIRQG